MVRERSEARWDALIKRDFDKAWEYTQPAYRALVGQKDYYKRFGGAGQWKGVQIHEVTCEPERCASTPAPDQHPQRAALSRPGTDRLHRRGRVRADGEWWFYQAL